MDYGQNGQIERVQQAGNGFLSAEQGNAMAGAQGIFSTPGEALSFTQEALSQTQGVFSAEAQKTDTVKKVEQSEQIKEAAMSSLDEMKNGQEFDIIGDGQVSEAEAKIASDAAMENMGFKDARKEAIDEEAMETIDRIVKSCGDDMAGLQTKVDDAKWTFLKNAFGRDRGDGLGGSGMIGGGR